jgi:hypothetical protein
MYRALGGRKEGKQKEREGGTKRQRERTKEKQEESKRKREKENIVFSNMLKQLDIHVQKNLFKPPRKIT